MRGDHHGWDASVAAAARDLAEFPPENTSDAVERHTEARELLARALVEIGRQAAALQLGEQAFDEVENERRTYMRRALTAERRLKEISLRLVGAAAGSAAGIDCAVTGSAHDPDRAQESCIGCDLLAIAGRPPKVQDADVVRCLIEMSKEMEVAEERSAILCEACALGPAAEGCPVCAEQVRWQKRLDAIPEVAAADGGGCESGDPLDFTEACVRIALTRLVDRADDLSGDLAKALARAEAAERVQDLQAARHVEDQAELERLKAEFDRLRRPRRERGRR